MSRKHKTVEQKIYNLIRSDHKDATIANSVDVGLMILVLFSVVVAFMNTFSLSKNFTTTLGILEIIFVFLFTVEYIIRIWTAEFIYPNLSPFRSRLRYARTPMAIVDLLSILPFFLPLFGISSGTLQAIKIVRLLRIFKINRYTNSLSIIARVLKNRASLLFSSIIVILVLIFIAAMLMYDIEHQAQPEVFDNALSAMWWAMATITTVGYGDIYPITTLGRIISALITFLGIGLAAIPTGIISAGFIEEAQKSKEIVVQKDHTYCPCCGKPLIEDN